MSQTSRRAVVLLLGGVLLGAPWATATTTIQMNLDQMCDGAAQIYRGTVVDVRESTVEGGGGVLPALTYTFRVEEVFKGDFETVKDTTVAEFTMIGSLKHHAVGRAPIPGLPVLRVGNDYLLMVAPEGPLGLTAPMGLGQGCFSVYGKEGARMAVNEAGNQGLFRDMAVSADDGRPVPYSTLAQLIRSAVEDN